MVQKAKLMNYAGLAAGAYIGNGDIFTEIKNIDFGKIGDGIVNIALAVGAIFAIKFLKLKGYTIVAAYVAAGYFVGKAITDMQKAPAAARMNSILRTQSSNVGGSVVGRSIGGSPSSDNPYAIYASQ